MDSRHVSYPLTLTRQRFVECDPWNARAPFILTLTGAMGSGKGYLAHELERRGMQRIVSTTTRPPRRSDIVDVDYHFVDAKSFGTALCEGQFVECARLAAHWYGVTRTDLSKALATGKPLLVVLDPRGVKRMRVLAQDQGWRIQTLFINQSRDQLARTLVRRGGADFRPIAPPDAAIMELLKQQAGWLAEVHWDVIINAPVGENMASALGTRLIETMRRGAERTISSTQPNRRLIHGISR